MGKVPADHIDQVGMKNIIINGDMRIVQRGTSFTPIAAGAYSIDRWRYSKSGSVVHTATQETDAPTDDLEFSLKLDTTTGGGTLAAGDFSFLQHRIEGFNFKAFNNKLVTLSFWVKATVTGTYCIGLVNKGFDSSYVDEYVVNDSEVWEKKSISIVIDTSIGTWAFDNTVGLTIDFTIAAGTNWHTTKGVWQASQFFATDNQVNGSENIGDIFQITGVQLELGGSASDFEHRPLDTELFRCERYYQLITLLSYAVAGGAQLTTFCRASIMFRPMRVTPTVVLPPAGKLVNQISFTTSSGNFPTTVGTNAISGLTNGIMTIQGSGYSANYVPGDAVALFSFGVTHITLNAEL